MTLDLEANEVEVKVLTSLASVTWITAPGTGMGTPLGPEWAPPKDLNGISYHTLSFTLSHSSLHRTKESPFTLPLSCPLHSLTRQNLSSLLDTIGELSARPPSLYIDLEG